MFSVLRNFCSLSISNILMRLMSFVIAPICMGQLGASTLGLWYLYNSFMMALTLVMSLGMRQYLALEYFHLEDASKQTLLESIIATYSIICLPVYILLSFSVPLLNYYIFFNRASTLLIYLCLSCSFMYLFVDIFFQIERYNLRVKSLIRIQLISTLINLVVSLIVILCIKKSIESLAFGLFCSIAFCFLKALKRFGQNFYFFTYISYKTIYSLVIKSIFFIPKSLATWFTGSINKWLLGYYGSLSDVGIYSLADSSMLLCDAIILQPLQSSYIPHMIQKTIINPYHTECYNKKIMSISMLILLLSLGVSYGIKHMLLAYIPEIYHTALMFVWPMALGFVFTIGAHLSSIYLYASNQKKFLTWIEILPALLNTFFSFLLIVRLKVMGCIIAQVLSAGIYFLVVLGYNFWLIERLKNSKIS